MNFSVKKVLFILFLSLVLSEMLLRLIGYHPGYWQKYGGFRQVDSLIVYKNFASDEYGIHKFSPWITDSLKHDFNWQSAAIEGKSSKFIKVWDKVSYIYMSFARLKYKGEKDIALFTKMLLWLMEEKEDWDTEFTKRYDEIKNKENLDNLERAIKHYVSGPFNSDGFRSIEFKVRDTSRVRVLIIGDSFAYGMAARPFFNSYPDLLLVRGYEVYNTGIPGVDPAQYAAIAKKYVSTLKPDLVVLNFYEGNDLMGFPRKPEKDKPHEHATNAGVFESYPLGKYLSPKDAYRYYVSLTEIPDKEDNWFNKVCSYTSIGSLIWGACYRQGWVKHETLQKYNEFHDFDRDSSIIITKPYLEVIDSVCQANKVPLLNIIIPDNGSGQNKNAEYVNIDAKLAEKLFGHHYIAPENVFLQDDFLHSDYHFNNSGSLKFANFIEEIIQDSVSHD